MQERNFYSGYHPMDSARFRLYNPAAKPDQQGGISFCNESILAEQIDINAGAMSKLQGKPGPSGKVKSLCDFSLCSKSIDQ